MARSFSLAGVAELISLLLIDSIFLGFHLFFFHLFLKSRNISADLNLYYPIGKLAFLNSVQYQVFQSTLGEKKIEKYCFYGR